MGAEQREMEWKRLIWPALMLTIGVVAAALVAAMPQAMLDVLMWRLGLPYLLSAATPPIGAFGRTMLALFVLIPFVAIAAVALRRRGYLIGVQHKPALASPDAALRVPTIRRADAHPDAAPRRPIRADEDLGPPLPIASVAPAVRVRPRAGEQTVPRDLDQPLAAFDPVAIPDVPRDPVRAVPPLAPAPACAPLKAEKGAPIAAPVTVSVADAAAPPEIGLDEGGKDHDLSIMEKQRSDQPGLPAEEAPATARPVMSQDAEAAASGSGDSLASLLDRLERGARQRKVPDRTPAPTPAPPAPSAAPSQPETLTDTLLMLRQMARR
ncbi:hypothetical protein [Sphingomonas mucosissima]|uniref:Uncharacterized protein n=1 Tax=Sphingomonas mucosissima TaxID=370959 RepID=A0A245ZQ84_9SPHN|nr:hypothetical protein [Sphingomonas mucosissima]OWK31915.1 hypothetical protein SPMU_02350 [Sphingomonas mucosissima]